MNPETRKRLAAEALAQATRCRIRAKIPHDAPIDPIHLAGKNGCEIRFLSLSSLEGMYSTEPRPTIILGSQRPAGRRNFTLVHELAHHIFNHGTKVDELKTITNLINQKPEEFSADVFAGYALMSQIAVKSTIRERNWDTATLIPEHIYILSSYFGVGYSTLINHLTWSLNALSKDKANELLKVQPKEIKVNYGASPEQEAIFVDFHWKNNCPVNLEVGDILILPNSVDVNPNNKINFINCKGNNAIWQAITPGYTNAVSKNSDWAVNIRIARKNYVGIASYRFFEKIGEEEE